MDWFLYDNGLRNERVNVRSKIWRQSLKLHCVERVQHGVFSGPYFPGFGLKTERYSVSLRDQPECGKIRTRKNSVFGYFSRSANYREGDSNIQNNFNVKMLQLEKTLVTGIHLLNVDTRLSDLH